MGESRQTLEIVAGHHAPINGASIGWDANPAKIFRDCRLDKFVIANESAGIY